jgi:fused signal recognition particle receptor
LYDVPPPETDAQAKKLATQIKKWIQDGRPKP